MKLLTALITATIALMLVSPASAFDWFIEDTEIVETVTPTRSTSCSDSYGGATSAQGSISTLAHSSSETCTTTQGTKSTFAEVKVCKYWDIFEQAYVAYTCIEHKN